VIKAYLNGTQMMKMTNNHTFVICAYKDSPFLAECIESLLKQTIQSKIICSTSTPNSLIKNTCEKYNIELRINPKQESMSADWNFAYSQSETNYLTIAHQDDIYEPDFLEVTLKHIKKVKKLLIVFTDYYEIREGKRVSTNKLLKIKRFMSFPWRFKMLRKSRFIARRIFMFGNAICCPSVTYARNNLPEGQLFSNELNNNCDWLAWINLRDLHGDFVYCPVKLVGHRIHPDSETSNRIDDDTRNIEDYAILQMLSPKPIAKLINSFYIKGQESNK
jgi:cellulose synthase/poly-beta-1,6-N-acetylglucosamine synthase-like glycosyltransferase